MSEETATPNAMAGTGESAPPEETVSTPEVNEPEQPVATEAQTTEKEGSEPEQSKAVEELIAQRKKRQAVEKELEYYKGLAEGRAAAHQPVEKQVAPSIPRPPSQDDFEFYEDYERAKEDYNVARILEQTEQRLTEKYEAERRRAEEQQAFETFQKRLNEAAKEDPDILDLVNERDFPVSAAMSQIIIRSDVGPEIIRWIDNNRDEATRIYHMTPILMAKELGALEVKLKNKPKPEPPKRVSAAPEPIKTVTPAGTTIINEDELPMDEWIRRRNEKQFKRR